MTITLDKVTAEMLKAVMVKNKKNDPKKFVVELIKNMYLQTV